MRRYIQYMYSYPHKTAYRPLAGVRLEDYREVFKSRENEWYVHVPFCESKCGYCNLFSVAGEGRDTVEAYLSAVERQAAQYRKALFAGENPPVFSGITVGGGTPLLLEEEQLERLFSIVRGTATMAERPQIVVETAPNQTTERKLLLLKENGAARVSVGVQSFSDRELLAMKRRHSAAQARRALSMLMGAGFDCVNLDLIYGVPGQTEESFLSSVREAVSFGVQEIFLYPLYVRRGSLMEAGIEDEERACAIYREAAGFLRAAGYRRDSMRRFVKAVKAEEKVREGTGNGGEETWEEPSFQECGYGNTLALGCGGRSYVGNLHFCSPYAVRPSECRKRIREFIATEDFLAVNHGILLTEDEEKRRYGAKHLLFGKGISERAYQGRFLSRPQEDFPFLLKWEADGLVFRKKSGDTVFWRLTDEGIGWSDALGPAFISEAVKRRMEEWQREEERRERHGG